MCSGKDTGRGRTDQKQPAGITTTRPATKHATSLCTQQPAAAQDSRQAGRPRTCMNLSFIHCSFIQLGWFGGLPLLPGAAACPSLPAAPQHPALLNRPRCRCCGGSGACRVPLAKKAALPPKPPPSSSVAAARAAAAAAAAFPAAAASGVLAKLSLSSSEACTSFAVLTSSSSATEVVAVLLVNTPMPAGSMKKQSREDGSEPLRQQQSEVMARLAQHSLLVLTDLLKTAARALRQV